jgi:hypothetical protein
LIFAHLIVCFVHSPRCAVTNGDNVHQLFMRT